MDLRVYVDGIARIICDLTRNTTVHDIIIALAQYKGKAGRYSLIERAPDGKQRTLSPNELTSELIHHPDWSYILRENPSHADFPNHQKRSKSLDGRKTPVQQPSIPETVTSSLSSSSTSGHLRTVPHHPNAFATPSSSSSSSASIKSSEKKKHTHSHQVFPSANTNNNNNNNNHPINSNEEPLPASFFIEQKRSSRAPIQIIEQDFGILDNVQTHRRSRPKSALPASYHEDSAFHIVHRPTHHHHHAQIQQQQQQYIALLKILKSQEIQAQEQQRELLDKQKEIDYREKTIQQNDVKNEFHLLAEQDLHLTSDSQLYSEEYTANELDQEFDYQKQLHSNYEHLQQQVTRCSTTLEQKRQLQEQIQLNIEQTHGDIEQMKSSINTDQQDINQYQRDLECSNVSFNQQEDLVRLFTQRNEEIERSLQQRRQQIAELENELSKLDELLISSVPQHFRPNSSTPQHYNSLPSTNSTGTTTDVFMPVRLQFVNSTLWKLCPSGIWV